MFNLTPSAKAKKTTKVTSEVGFSQPQQNTLIFGAAQPTAPQTSLFGQSSTTAFGQTAPQPTTSLVGHVQHTSTAGFGSFGQVNQPTNAFASAVTAFGQPTASAGNTTGTVLVKYQPTTGTDTLMKGGMSNNVTTKQHCITAMKEYEAKSLEELRMEDYLANRKDPQAGTSADFGGFGAAQPIGFSQPQQNTLIFGAAQPTAPQTSLFGQSSTTAFGQTAPQPTTSLVGHVQHTSTAGFGSFGRFNQPTNAFASAVTAFDQPTASAGNATGTLLVKYQPTTGTDTLMKGGTPNNVNTNQHCITAMKEYEVKSLEELRMEDYLANRKGPQAGTSAGFGGFGAAQPIGNTGGLFGASAQQTTGLFGQQPIQQSMDKNNLFGTNIFGQPAIAFRATAHSRNNLLIKPFSIPATSTTNNPEGIFYASTQQTTGLFDQQYAKQPTENKNLFRASLYRQPSPAFGATAKHTNRILTKQFSTQATSSFGFGVDRICVFDQTRAPSLFGQPAAQNTAASAFDQRNVTGFGGFGAPGQKNSVFQALATNKTNRQKTGQTKAPCYAGFRVPQKPNTAFGALSTDNKPIVGIADSKVNSQVAEAFNLSPQPYLALSISATDNKSVFGKTVSTVNDLNNAALSFDQTKTACFGGLSIPPKPNFEFNAPATDLKPIVTTSKESGLFGQKPVPALEAHFSCRTSAVNTGLNTLKDNKEPTCLNTDVSKSCGFIGFGIQNQKPTFEFSFGASTVKENTTFGATPKQTTITSNHQILSKGTSLFGENPAFNDSKCSDETKALCATNCGVSNSSKREVFAFGIQNQKHTFAFSFGASTVEGATPEHTTITGNNQILSKVTLPFGENPAFKDSKRSDVIKGLCATNSRTLKTIFEISCSQKNLSGSTPFDSLILQKPFFECDFKPKHIIGCTPNLSLNGETPSQNESAGNGSRTASIVTNIRHRQRSKSFSAEIPQDNIPPSNKYFVTNRHELSAANGSRIAAIVTNVRHRQRSKSFSAEIQQDNIPPSNKYWVTNRRELGLFLNNPARVHQRNAQNSSESSTNNTLQLVRYKNAISKSSLKSCVSNHYITFPLSLGLILFINFNFVFFFLELVSFLNK